MNNNIHFGYLSVSSLLNKKIISTDKSISAYDKSLQNLGGILCTKENYDRFDTVLYFVRTGGTENTILNMIRTRRQKYNDDTVFLVAYPSNNSLPASLEILARLQQDNIKGKLFYLQDSDDQLGYNLIKNAIHNENVSHSLSEIRIGLIGDPSDWLVASQPDFKIIKDVWGPHVININIDQIKHKIKEEKFVKDDSILKNFVQQASEVNEPSSYQIESAVNLYFVIKKVIEFNNLDAIAVRCFDLIVELKTTGCICLSELTDEGIIAGCEGDLVSMIGMIWAYKLLNEIPWMANPARIDRNKNTLVLAHCTVARSMIKNYKIRSHFESNLGIGIQGEFNSGPATIFRIGGKFMEKIWLAEGNIIKSGNAEDLCRTQVEIELKEEYNVEDLLINPLGNHLILAKGYHAKKLKEWWTEMILSQKLE
jgi:L-fucose isomerase-like protein